MSMQKNTFLIPTRPTFKKIVAFVKKKKKIYWKTQFPILNCDHVTGCIPVFLSFEV